MPLLSVDLERVEVSQRQNTARQLAIYINDRLGGLVKLLPSQPSRVEPFTRQAATSAQEDHFVDSQAFSLYVTVSFMLGLNWPRDPVYKHLVELYHQIHLPYEQMLNILMFQAQEEKTRLIQALPGMHKQCLTLLREPAEAITASTFSSWWDTFVASRNLSRPADAQALLAVYDADFRAYMGWDERKTYASAYTHQERWARQNMGLPVEEKTWLTVLSPSERYLLLLNGYLSLAFGRFYVSNLLLEDLHAALDIRAGNLNHTCAALSRFLENHLHFLESSHHAA